MTALNDNLDIPEFLRRAMTPEIRRRLDCIRIRARERRIKNPRKRASRKAKGLGAAFGLRQRKGT